MREPWDNQVSHPHGTNLTLGPTGRVDLYHDVQTQRKQYARTGSLFFSPFPLGRSHMVILCLTPSVWISAF